MAVTTQAGPITFLWEGRDKRGVKLKGQQIATNQNLVPLHSFGKDAINVASNSKASKLQPTKIWCELS